MIRWSATLLILAALLLLALLAVSAPENSTIRLGAVGVAAALVILLLLAAACVAPPSNRPCNIDDDCPADEVCELGRCAAGDPIRSPGVDLRVVEKELVRGHAVEEHRNAA